MARNTYTSYVFAIVACVLAFALSLCASTSATSVSAPLVRSFLDHPMRSESTEEQTQERVFDFAISESRDSASWTAFGREWRVRLELSDVVQDNTDYYYGTLIENENERNDDEETPSEAAAAISFALLPGSSFSGMIATSEATYWIRAMPVSVSNEREYNDYLRRRNNDNIDNNIDNDDEETDLGIFMIREQGSALSPTASFATPLSDEPLVDTDAQEVDDEQQLETHKRAITTYKVYVAFDQQWASASVNPWASQANTLSIFNDVNAVYKAAGLGVFQVVYGKQLSNSKSSLNDMLNYWSASGNSAYSDKSYTNYMWLIGKNVGGLGWVGTSCSSGSAQNRKTAVAGLVSYSRLFTVKTISHELGHNRGASHLFTNACSSTKKTSCQCSVMSYCFPTSSNNPRGAVNFFDAASVSQMKSKGCY